MLCRPVEARKPHPLGTSSAAQTEVQAEAQSREQGQSVQEAGTLSFHSALSLQDTGRFLG